MFGKKGFADNLISFFIGILVVVLVALSAVLPTIQTAIDTAARRANEMIKRYY